MPSVKNHKSDFLKSVEKEWKTAFAISTFLFLSEITIVEEQWSNDASIDNRTMPF